MRGITETHETIDAFVFTKWRHELGLHTAHYTEGYYFIYNSGE